MNTKELISQIRKIEIKTRRIVDDITGGAYHSVFKGSGIEFSEVREYTPEDDVRDIDWNITARTGEPYIKKYTEERELTVMLIVDISASSIFGSGEKSKRDIGIEMAALLAFSAIRNKDKVGLLLFTDDVELYLPPRSSRSHALRLVRELIATTPKNKGTNMKGAMEFLMTVMHKKSVIFLLSDFIDNSNYEKVLKVANRRHDLIAIRVLDKLELAFPKSGNLVLEDSESGILSFFRGGSKKAISQINNLSEIMHNRTYEILKKAKIDMIDIRCNEDYILPLMNFFNKRSSR